MRIEGEGDSHQHVEAFLVLETRHQGCDEGMAGDGGEDVAFVSDVFDLL